MKIPIKHLAPYLPYGLNGIHKDKRIVFHTDNIWTFILNAKPILRPLSDLTKEDWIDEFIFSSDLIESIIKRNGFEFAWLETSNYLKLLENHFDVFGLIEKGLAIDINKVGGL